MEQQTVRLRMEVFFGVRVAFIYLAFSLRNMANCCTDIRRSDSLNSYGMFHPIGPYILLSWTSAWKKQSPNSSFRNSGPGHRSRRDRVDGGARAAEGREQRQLFNTNQPRETATAEAYCCSC